MKFCYGWFSKRKNSTAQPSSSFYDNQFTVFLKGGTSRYHPTFILQVSFAGDLPNYAACKWTEASQERQYLYYVRDAVYLNNGHVELECECDWFATFRTEILDAYAFIVYSTSPEKTNIFIPDTRLMPAAIPNHSSAQGTSVLPNNDECIVLNCISDNGDAMKASGGIAQYVFPDFNYFKTFINKVFKMYDLSTLEQSMQQYLNASTPDSLLGASIYFYTPTIGSARVNATIGKWDSGENVATPQTRTESMSVSVNVPWGNIPLYCRNSRYCTVYAYVPFVGIVPLDPEVFAWINEVKFLYAYDNVNGSFIATMGTGDNMPLMTFNGKVSAEIAFSTFTNDFARGTIEGIGELAKSAASFASLDFGGGVSSALSAAGNMALSANRASASLIGGNNTRIHMDSKPSIYIRYYPPTAESVRTAWGMPVMSTQKLSEHRGYMVRCTNPGIKLAVSDEVNDYINSTLEGGMWIE